MWVQSLASPSGLRSGIAASIGHSCSSNSTPSLGIFICCRYNHLKKKKSPTPTKKFCGSTQGCYLMPQREFIFVYLDYFQIKHIFFSITMESQANIHTLVWETGEIWSLDWVPGHFSLPPPSVRGICEAYNQLSFLLSAHKMVEAALCPFFGFAHCLSELLFR